MKKIRYCIAIAMSVVFFAAIAIVRADDAKTAKPTPYPLETCLVCGMKLGEKEKPYIFVYKGQEIKLCDISEKADFDKNPDKYLKKLADAKAKLKKSIPIQETM